MSNMIHLVRPFVVETFWKGGQLERRVHHGSIESNWNSFSDTAHSFHEVMASTAEKALQTIIDAAG